MDTRAIVTSRKYAQAFLNIFLDSITPEVYASIKSLESFLSSHRNALIFFGLHHIPTDIKLKLLNDLQSKFTLYEPMKKLFETLIRHNRSQLMPQVLKNICQYYRIRKNTMLFSIQSSHELDKESVATIEKFLAHHTNKHITSVQYINKNLIAGLRLQSDTLLWEYSIHKEIKKLTQIVTAKGYQ